MGTLFIVATPIGNLGDMTPRAVDVLRSVALIAAEDTRHSGTLLRAFDIDTPMVSYHHHNRAARAARLLAAVDQGDVALISDAGTPAIADPGHELVVTAVAAGHRIVPVPGPSSVIAAVSASGLVPGPFVFVGFLPRTGEERRVTLGKVVSTGFPFVLFESPLRAARTLHDVESIAPGRIGLVAREITKVYEEFQRGNVAELAGRLEDVPPRGEVVLVIGAGTTASDASPDIDAEDLARSILAQGVKPSRAARELSSILGLDAADAYALVQRVAKECGTG
ncbi:MAG: 16S rRNA (cytidine(1402)-2'-O)-methyltransferase [Chloroflexota bacterium]|nr:16S rRNA (cytidine(1402)-2'-O)-methyltransferase [Chloroflexota bacterium]